MVGRHLVLLRPVLEGVEEGIDIGDEDVGGPHQLHVEAGIEHVRGGHSLVDEARLGADDLGKVGEEGDHVVLGHRLDGVDPGDIEGRVAAHLHTLSAGRLGHHPISARAVVAWASISNQIRKRDSGDQIAVIAGRL